MIPSELTTSPSIPEEQRNLVRQAVRIEICLYLTCFLGWNLLFAMIMMLNYVYHFAGNGSILCVYLTTTFIMSAIIYLKAKIRYRALYITLTWNQRITPEEIQNVLHRKHNINREQILEFDEEENNIEKFCFCMEEKENSEFVKLNCNHIFHTECLAQWLVNNNSCPNCRETNIITRNDFNE